LLTKAADLLLSPDDVGRINVLDVGVLEVPFQATFQEHANVFQDGVATGICAVVVAGAVILQQVLQAAHTSTRRLSFKQGWSIQTRHV